MNAPIMIRTCSIWRSLEVVGDTPTLLILEACWLGARKFDELRQRTGLLKALLSDRLKRLVEAGVLAKHRYTDSPPRYDYVLTEKARDSYWISLMMLRWESLWNHDPGKIEVVLTHKPCGHEFTPEPACGHCHGRIDATQVEWREGPGVGLMAPLYSRRRQQRDSVSHTSLMDQSAQLMGDRWASLIMRSIFTNINRFDDIRQDTAIATNILTERLTWLQEIGVIRQHAYPSNPPRHEYRVTRKGVDYYPILLMLMRWGDRYFVSPEGPPVVLDHKGCGHALDPQVVCSHCGATVVADDVSFEIREGQAAA